MSTKLNWREYRDREPLLTADEGLFQIRIYKGGTFSGNISLNWASGGNGLGFCMARTGFKTQEAAVAWVEANIEFARENLAPLMYKWETAEIRVGQ